MALYDEIAGLMKLAKGDLSYCVFLIKYPSTVGKTGFDLHAPKDQFYKKVYNLSFSEALLIVGSLLDANDKRVMSFWNDHKLTANVEHEIKVLTEDFSLSGLKTVRDQIIAHQDSSNTSNSVASYSSRSSGIIEPKYIRYLNDILDRMIQIFCNTFKDYDQNFFEESEWVFEIQTIIREAPPQLTTDNLI